MKIVSWNVNGIRASVKKGFADVVLQLDADIFCVQETKAQDDQVREALRDLGGHKLYSNSAERKGYSGTAILSKQEPLSFSLDMGRPEHDAEGRVLHTEHEAFHLVNVYVPNSGNGLKRLDYRQKWDGDFKNYLKELKQTKPLIVTGDFNVAHTENDLANPKSNYNKTSGFTQVEIDGLDAMLKDLDLVDSFRALHPETFDKYTFWSMRGGARSRNVGWRIDYFLVSASLWPKVTAAGIHDHIMGSDHCPISLELKL
ncbi:exodeoxyribonuclease III [Maribacter sp. 2307ULW6-5]|uniref:exodeoxyribonuclease III n=1 Tax=Maribacter sp. 2307ULW6-5 TaxID=3386275 RepID=UPI0039BD3EBE